MITAFLTTLAATTAAAPTTSSIDTTPAPTIAIETPTASTIRTTTGGTITLAARETLSSTIETIDLTTGITIEIG